MTARVATRPCRGNRSHRRVALLVAGCIEGREDRLGESGRARASAGRADLGREGRGVHRRGRAGGAARREPIRLARRAARQSRSPRAAGQAGPRDDRGGRRPALGFEMLATDDAPAVIRYLARSPKDAAGLGDAVNWARSGWPRVALLPAHRPGGARRQRADRRHEPLARRDRSRAPKRPSRARPGAHDAAAPRRAHARDAARDDARARASPTAARSRTP